MYRASPILVPTEAPIKIYFERKLRSFPKLESDGTWKLQEIETIDFDRGDATLTIIRQMEFYNFKDREKTEQAQSSKCNIIRNGPSLEEIRVFHRIHQRDQVKYQLTVKNWFWCKVTIQRKKHRLRSYAVAKPPGKGEKPQSDLA